MQLTSEVEAIMNGNVERKEGAVERAIGVSTVNLINQFLQHQL